MRWWDIVIMGCKSDLGFDMSVVWKEIHGTLFFNL
jgi:hypothetical protein